MATASTTCAELVVQVAGGEARRSSREAARESAGTPWRYLPVSTPRPSGDQGSSPRPSALAAPATSSSASRFSSEYSTSLATSGHPRLLEHQRGGVRRLPARVVRHPDVARPPRRHRPLQRRERLLDRRRRRSTCGPARGRRGRAEARQRRVELAQQRPPGGVDHPLAGAAGDAGLGADHHVVAGDAGRRGSAPSELLGGAVGVAVRRVDQVAAGGQERPQLVAGVVLVGGAAPGHRAEARAGTPRGPDRPIRLWRMRRTRNGAPRAPIRQQHAASLPRHGTRAEPRLLGRGQRRGQHRPRRRRPTGSGTPWPGRPRPTARTPRPCWPGSARQTERIGLGAAVMQIPARTPGDDRDDRRHAGHALRWPVPARARASPARRCSEGWHGVRFDEPLGRTREYVDIVRMALRRETGRATRASTARCRCRTAPARRCKLTVHPVRERLPIYLAAVGPKNLELAGEIADGWLAIFYSPEHAGDLLAPLTRRRGAGPAGDAGGRRWPGSTSCRPCRWSSTTTSAAAAEPLRRLRRAVRRRAWARARRTSTTAGGADGVRGGGAPRCRTSTSARRHRDAAAAVPLELIDPTSLIGPRERIRERLVALRRGRGHHAQRRPLRCDPRAATACRAHDGRAAGRDRPGDDAEPTRE